MKAAAENAAVQFVVKSAFDAAAVGDDRTVFEIRCVNINKIGGSLRIKRNYDKIGVFNIVVACRTVDRTVRQGVFNYR